MTGKCSLTTLLVDVATTCDCVLMFLAYAYLWIFLPWEDDCCYTVSTYGFESQVLSGPAHGKQVRSFSFRNRHVQWRAYPAP
jgi:hypothetical protein